MGAVRATNLALAAATPAESRVLLQIGEHFTASRAFASKAALTNTVAANVTSLSLAAGEWDLFGFLKFDMAGSTNVALIGGGIHTVSAVLPGTDDGQFDLAPFIGNGNGFSLRVGPRRTIVAGAAEIFYLNVIPYFTVSTLNVWGTIRARRAA